MPKEEGLQTKTSFEFSFYRAKFSWLILPGFRSVGKAIILLESSDYVWTIFRDEVPCDIKLENFTSEVVH
jgi:hypothetical protein